MTKKTEKKSAKKKSAKKVAKKKRAAEKSEAPESDFERAIAETVARVQASESAMRVPEGEPEAVSGTEDPEVLRREIERLSEPLEAEQPDEEDGLDAEAAGQERAPDNVEEIAAGERDEEAEDVGSPEEKPAEAEVAELDFGPAGEEDEEPEALDSEIEEPVAEVLELPGESPFETVAELKGAIECLLFTTTHPLSLIKLRNLLDKIDKRTLRGAVAQLQIEYEARGSGIQIIESAEGFQMCTRPEFASTVLKLHRQRKKNPLTTTALETLAIVAYKQPITRAEIEMIRGVETSGVLRNLCDMNLVQVVGRKEVVGRPQLYGTTNQFLKTFGLSSINDLPTIQNLRQRYQSTPSFLERALEESAEQEQEEESSSGASEEAAVEGEAGEPLADAADVQGEEPTPGSGEGAEEAAEETDSVSGEPEEEATEEDGYSREEDVEEIELVFVPEPARDEEADTPDLDEDAYLDEDEDTDDNDDEDFEDGWDSDEGGNFDDNGAPDGDENFDDDGDQDDDEEFEDDGDLDGDKDFDDAGAPDDIEDIEDSEDLDPDADEDSHRE